MKTVLVTGATGFIGRQSLPLLLAQSYDVHGVYWKQEPCNIPDVSFHRANLLDASQLSSLLQKVRPSHLLHFAWYAVPGLYWTSQENKQWLNSSQHLVREFQSNGGQRAVLAGTCAEYDWSFVADAYDERSSPVVPATLYGQCKQSLGSFLDSFSRDTGLSSAWGRIFMLYGPHEHPARLVSGMIRAFLQHQTAPCTLGEQIRDVLYVKDVAAAFVALLESHVSGPVNIASGEPLRVKDLIDQIARPLNGQSLIRFGERPMPAGEPQKLVANVRRLHEEVGWKPNYSLSQGLEETIDWWSQQSVATPD